MNELDKKELNKECFKLFGDTACKESYLMREGLEAVVDYVISKFPTDEVLKNICHCKNPSERWDSGQTNNCDNCNKVIDAC